MSLWSCSSSIVLKPGGIARWPLTISLSLPLSHSLSLSLRDWICDAGATCWDEKRNRPRKSRTRIHSRWSATINSHVKSFYVFICTGQVLLLYYKTEVLLQLINAISQIKFQDSNYVADPMSLVTPLSPLFVSYRSVKELSFLIQHVKNVIKDKSVTKIVRVIRDWWVHFLKRSLCPRFKHWLSAKNSYLYIDKK